MTTDRSFLVVLIAAATGVVLGRGAKATIHSPGATVEAVPVGALAPSDHPGAKAGETQSSSRDEGEPEEAHPDATGENPYDEGSPGVAHPVPLRLQIPLRDGMLRLSGGHFLMGSSNTRAPVNERPVRPVSVGPFWIDRTEVTVAAYRGCVLAGVCALPARASATCTYDADDPDLPVSCVHWADADTYCGWAGKRLPSEREWEYAARGPLAVPYPWGTGPNCADAVTIINEQTGKSCAPHPARVGTHPGGASIFGVQDMSGNLEEWTSDWYVELLGPGPAPRAGSAHVLRGGGWLSTPMQSRTTSRNWGSALEAGANVGFRCAKDDTQ